MPRYFSDRRDGVFDPDTEGTELPNSDAARIAAITYAAGVVKDRPDQVRRGEDFRVEVLDERKLLLYTVAITGTDGPATWCPRGKDPASGRSRQGGPS